MVKIRPPMTSKYALRRCIDAIPMPEIEAALDKSPKKIYQLSDPAHEREISVRDALKLERLAHRAAGIRPFADLFTHHIDESPDRIGSLRENMLLSQSHLGKVADTMLHALSPQSESGKKLSAHEIQTIMFEIEAFETIVRKMKKAALQFSREEE